MKRFAIPMFILCVLLLSGCEKYSEIKEIDGIFKKNDLLIKMKADRGDNQKFAVKEIKDGDGENYLEINVENEFSLRGEAKIEPGRKYKLSVTLKNKSADPLIHYSFWEKPVTSKRYFVFNGENGNPPYSETQKIYEQWVTFEEIFETKENEDAFTLSLISKKGIFYIKEISIEEL